MGVKDINGGPAGAGLAAITPHDAIEAESKDSVQTEIEAPAEGEELDALEVKTKLSWRGFSQHVELSPTAAYTVRKNESASVRFFPGKVDLHESWQKTPVRSAIKDGAIDLNEITPKMVRRMESTRLRVLLHCLSHVRMQVERKDPDGYLLTGVGKVESTRPYLGKLGFEVMGKSFGKTSKENVATALAHKIWASGDAVAFAKFFAACPEAVLPMLNGQSSKVLTADNMALIMKTMAGMKYARGLPTAGKQSKPQRGFTGWDLHALGSLLARYLKFNAGSDPTKVWNSVLQLQTLIHDSGATDDPKTLGIVCGACFSGMLKHFNTLKLEKSTQRLWLSSGTNLFWASSAFAGPLGAAFAITLVSLNTLHNHATEPGIRDLAASCEGDLAAHWLQHPPEGWDRQDVHDALAWMTGTINANRRVTIEELHAPTGRKGQQVVAAIGQVKSLNLPSEAKAQLDLAELAEK